MSLTPSDARCQGRPMGNTMARECFNCERRTDVPADVKSVPWIPPPAIVWWWGCPSHIAPITPITEDA